MNTSSPPNGGKKYWTDDPELVEKYILGNISREERLRMDAEIAECEPCKEKLRIEMEIVSGIKRHGRDHAKSKLRSKLQQQERNQLQRYSYIGLAAAVVIIGIGIGVYRIWFNDLSMPKKFNQTQIVFKERQPLTDSLSTTLQSEPKQSAEKKDGHVLAETSPSTRDAEKVAAQSGAMKDEKIQTPIPSSTRRLQPAIAANADGGETKEVWVKPFSQKVWLIGAVVMVPQQGNEAAQGMALQEIDKGRTESRAMKKGASHTRSFSIAKGEGSQQIVLQQRPLFELPASRRSKLATVKHIETLIEHNERGLYLTMYNDNLNEKEFQEAIVEVTQGDSLIVTLQDQKIIYKLPESWNLQERTLSR